MKNELLRHLLSTIKYRFDKSVQGSSNHFGEFRIGRDSRSTIEIVNHMYHVLISTREFIDQGAGTIQLPDKLSLLQEIARFDQEISVLDLALEREELSIAYTKRIMQGPFSDMLTHIGQISMMQGINNNPIPKEDFSAAAIVIGLNKPDTK